MKLSDMLKPKYCGEIIATNPWNNNTVICDIYNDIARAISLIPDNSNPFYFLMGRKPAYYMNQLDYNHKPVYQDILINLFNIRSDEVIILKDRIIRISNNVPESIILLISDQNDIVIISIDGIEHVIKKN